MVENMVLYISINQSLNISLSMLHTVVWLVLSLYESIVDSKPGGYFFLVHLQNFCSKASSASPFTVQPLRVRETSHELR